MVFWEDMASAVPIEARKTQGFNVWVRTYFRVAGGMKCPKTQPRQGRTSIAQRGSAGKSGTNDSSPGGTTEFSRTHFSPEVTAPQGISEAGFSFLVRTHGRGRPRLHYEHR
jgi:hypothetical protein